MVLNCSKYPLENGFMNQVCMGDTNSSENESEPVDDSSVVVIEKTTKSKSSQSKTHPIKKCDSSTQVYINKTNRCASQCYAFDSVDQQEMEEHARYTLAILGLIAVCFFICCLLISLVKRCHGLDFTDYCLLFGGASFAMSTFLQIVNIQFRDLISCTQYNSISIVVVPELHHIPCVLVAIMTYYLGTTGRLWCVMACFGWRKSLMNSPKHDTNNFRFKSSTIACTASFPIILLALMSRSTNIDIFTGLCSITQGSSSLQNLFTTLREFAFLILSIFPLFCGCLRQLSPFNNSYNRNTNPKPLFKNLLTILFTLIYFLFTTFWFYYSVQLFFATSVNVTKETTINQWDLITAIKTYADPILAILTCAIFLISIILKCYFQTHQSLAPIQKMNDGMTVYLPTTLPPAPPPNYVIGINQVDEYDSTMLSNSNKIGR
uniref:Frizzled-4 n=1 Tax=Rhabditophanes sp. KR3021 TaxID=114890 RepID=A0AC35UCH7_9BILA